MSKNDAVFILEYHNEFRVKRLNLISIENIEYQQEHMCFSNAKKNEMIFELFRNATPYKHQYNALQEAYSIMRQDDAEYGIRPLTIKD